MIVNSLSLLARAPIKDMARTKERFQGTSYGLSEAGYDIRIKQEVDYTPPDPIRYSELLQTGQASFTDTHFRKLLNEAFYGYTVVDHVKTLGRFVLASAIEEFDMPTDLVGTVKDKSTWARRGLSVFNTVIEPGWKGFLTLELVFHGQEPVHIPAGAGIAQVLFDRLTDKGDYADGKYQNAADKPQQAILI